MTNLTNSNKTKQPHTRRQDKIRHLITWLAKFDFSTRELIGLSMGVNHIGQWNFFKQMIDDDIINQSRIAGTHKKIYILGSNGNSASTMYCPNVKIKEYKKTPSLVAISHSFCIQYLISKMYFDNQILNFQTEKELYHLNLKRRPDAIITLSNNKKVAIEIEITKKGLPMIYFNYLCHIKNIRAKVYDSVHYYFNNPDILKFYKELYEARMWPSYDKSNTGGRLVNQEKKLDVTQIQNYNLFKFEFDDLYKI